MGTVTGLSPPLKNINLIHQKIKMNEKDPKVKYQSFRELNQKFQNLTKTRYQERIWLSENQYQMYRTALYGLKAYSKEEVYKMTFQVKNKITKLYRKAQVVLNRWKQEIINKMFEKLCSIKFKKFSTNPFFTVFNDTVFSVENFGKQTDDSFHSKFTFAQLGITKEQIIRKLVEKGVLPINFYKL